jgi:putative ABC transport system permease protein
VWYSGRTLSTTTGTLLALTACGVLIARPWIALFALPLFALWLISTSRGRQTLAITRIGLATVPQRLGATSVVVVGIAGVVGVLVALLAMAQGFESTLKSAGNEQTAIVLRAGANSELSSGLDRTAAVLIAQAPGVRRDARDVPVASAEVVVVSNVPKRSTGTDANVEVRGVGPQTWKLRPEVRIIRGRRFEPGMRELIVGQGALAQFRGLEPGSIVQLNGQAWKVTGVFASGDSHESEIWPQPTGATASSP